MEPDNLRFGGGTAGTFLSPVVLLAIIVAGVFICFSSRRNALVAFLAAAILIPPDQVLLLGSAHFPMLRILGVFGLVRVLYCKLLRKEQILSGGMNRIDKAMIVLTLAMFIDGILLWQVWGEVVYQLGSVLSTLVIYLLLRFLIRDFDDIRSAIRVLAGIAVVVALFMAYERATGKNLFYSSLGGARADALGSALVAVDHFRAAGPFGHPILAGTFGGILLPLFFGLGWSEKKDRKYAVLGVVASTVISFAASSSTALFGFLGGIIGLCFWPLRRRMSIIRWGILLVLVCLHLYMTMPVWHLISDIDLTGSSSSYHRYQLINQCILHFWDWAFVGTKNYASWGWDMWDLSNQYVLLADQYGLIPFASLVAIIVSGFSYVGKTCRLAGNRKQQVFVWALGASLFANVVAFFGISYFDQTIVAWYALLAMIAAAASSIHTGQRSRNMQVSPDETPAVSLENSCASVGLAHPMTAKSLVIGMNEFCVSRGIRP